MPHVTTTCPRCGTIDVPLAEIVLRVCEDDSSGACVVRCPACGSRFAKDANDAMMIMMVTFGVDVTVWQRPAEVDERPTHLPPLRYSEVSDFRRLLDDATLVEWAAPAPNEGGENA